MYIQKILDFFFEKNKIFVLNYIIEYFIINQMHLLSQV